MKITIEILEFRGSKTIRLDTIGFEPNNLNLNSVISDNEINCLKTLFLKLFTNPVPQEQPPLIDSKPPVFDNSKNINKVFKKKIEILKFKIRDFVRVISKNTKMMNQIGQITRIRNGSYFVEFDPNTSGIFEEKDLELHEKQSLTYSGDVFKKPTIKEEKLVEGDIVQKIDKRGRKGKRKAVITIIIENTANINYIDIKKQEICNIDRLVKVNDPL